MRLAWGLGAVAVVLRHHRSHVGALAFGDHAEVVVDLPLVPECRPQPRGKRGIAARARWEGSLQRIDSTGRRHVRGQYKCAAGGSGGEQPGEPVAR